MLPEQVFNIEEYKYDTSWQAKARKHQSAFRESEMKVPAVPNTSRSGCYAAAVSAFHSRYFTGGSPNGFSVYIRMRFSFSYTSVVAFVIQCGVRRLCSRPLSFIAL